jgi:16S rRNA (adenine1518-N6/adenine1519-N6)-dimethyltransferase
VTHGRSDIRELLTDHGLRPSRALGQNFVADGNTVRKIVRLAGVGEGSRVVEIGAGLGSLTLALVESGAVVTAIEIDRHVIGVLRTLVEPLGVRVVEADALKIDWSQLLGDGPVPNDRTGGEEGGADGPVGVDGPGGADGPVGADGAVGAEPDGRPWSLVANLPYNVAVPLIVRVLEHAHRIDSLLVMVQREVGERLAARARDDAYGAVSVKVAYWATATVVGRVPASVFIPRPKVDSVLVRIDRHPLPSGDTGSVPYERLFAVVRGGFAHRRKMLRRSLDGLVDPDVFEAVGIPSTARAEELSLDEWGRLAAWGPGQS